MRAELEFRGAGPGVDPRKFQFRPTGFVIGQFRPITGAGLWLSKQTGVPVFEPPLVAGGALYEATYGGVVNAYA